MKQFVTILLSVLLFSCEKPVHINSDSSESQIVLNSIISTDSVWRVNLSYSKSIFNDSEFALIDDATVKVNNLNSGQSFFLESKGNGCYGRALNPTEGHEYELVVSTSDNREVRGRTYVPSVLNVDVVKRNAFDSDGFETIEIDIEIEDNLDEDNYYVWELVENKILQTLEGEEEPPNEVLDINYAFSDSDGNTEENLKTLNSQIFVSDKEFEGKKYEAKVTIGNDILTNPDAGNNANSTSQARFSLRVMAVSADLYEYLRTYEIYRQNEVKVTSISQPVSIYSNIENGLGIFGGYILKEFPIE
jgi:hypothetical protein